jgi:hypothetical protein
VTFPKERNKRLLKHSINEELCGTAHGLASVVAELHEQRTRILEDFAAAYLAETGFSADEVYLVEKRSPREIHWYFEKKEKRKKS